MKPLHCFDGVTASAIPAAALVLGYVDGDYPTYEPLKERFKKASTHVLSVTVLGTPGADLADCERGNIRPPEVALWCRSELRAGRHPGVYGSRDYLDACKVALQRLRIQPHLVAWFLANYIQVAPHLENVQWPRYVPSDYVGWQFADSIPLNGHTIDASIVNRNYARTKGWTGRAPGQPRTLTLSLPRF